MLRIIWNNLCFIKDFLLEDHCVRYRVNNSDKVVIGSPFSCGIDMKVQRTVIPPHTSCKIPLGFFIEHCPSYIKPTVLPRSSTNLNCRLDLPVGSGDPDYTGEYQLVVRNISDEEYIIQDDERLCQIIFEFFLPLKYTKCINHDIKPIDRIRGADGFGSSNKCL